MPRKTPVSQPTEDPQHAAARRAHSAARALADKLTGKIDTFGALLDLEEHAGEDGHDRGHARIMRDARAAYNIDTAEYDRLFDYVARARDTDPQLDQFLDLVETDQTAHLDFGYILGFAMAARVYGGAR